ncbi:hypothetical protein RRG08_058026 [Elysia crispata]|uniref:Uncharacterized protein n=1 Tax=Elysia crispata TaxID=231223 RepID=A0AAE1APV6_9GAST|nr:hypothetical protein RRG08_058026 [Elysia crispata]
MHLSAESHLPSLSTVYRRFPTLLQANNISLRATTATPIFSASHRMVSHTRPTLTPCTVSIADSFPRLTAASDISDDR